MSPSKTDPEAPLVAGEEESGGTIPPGDELTAALQEASEAVNDASAPESRPAGGDVSPDKLMIEAMSSELQALKGEYEERLAEHEDLKDQHLRLQAEFENFRRRSLKERQEAFQYGHQGIVKDLLTTVDNLDRASQHAQGAGSGDLTALLEGVDLVSRELLGVFGKYGVTSIEAEGRPFDPAVHEAMGQLEDSSIPPNTVVQVLQSGYMLRDRMLRPALVMVSRLPEAVGGDAKAGKSGASSSEEGSTE
jgi:molecular chaperone GrpE